jgi:hypothetical protein
MLTGKNTAAIQVTASMNVLPILRLLNPDLATMCAALQGEIVAHPSLRTTLHLYFRILVHNFDDTTPYSAFAGKKFTIAEDVKSTLCSGQGDTSTVI